MHRISGTAGVALALTIMALAVPMAAAGTPVIDPDTLQPPPPPGSQCQAVGPTAIMCQTAVSFPSEGEPLFDVACGTVYQTGTDDRTGIRWYADGKLAERHYTAHADGTWSLSADGSGPSIRFTANWISSSYWTTPGDEGTIVETIRGLHFHGIAPGLGAALILAGQIDPDGTVHGVNNVDEPLGEIAPQSIVAIESVLCA
jgi:hypothetical protein